MKHMHLFLVAALAISALPVLANPIQVFTDPDPRQDAWILEGPAEELGTFVFPQDELISSANLGIVSYIPCPTDYQGGANFQILIQNLTGKDWDEVYYVGDPETQLTNVDELLGQVGFLPGLAFKIDAVGANTPLVSESMIPDGIFQAGETWEFVIQDYVNFAGGLPEAFDSLGIAGASTGSPPSTGSIVAIPEPSVVALFGVFGLGLFIRRKLMI